MDLDKFRVWQERHLLTFVFLVLQSTFLRWEMLEHVSEVDSESFRNWDVANFCPGVALKLRVHDGSRRFRPFFREPCEEQLSRHISFFLDDLCLSEESKVCL